MKRLRGVGRMSKKVIIIIGFFIIIALTFGACIYYRYEIKEKECLILMKNECEIPVKTVTTL